MPAKEIGWYKVTRNESAESDGWLNDVPPEFEILIWHHDAFTLPPGATPLYSSAYCPDQAFVLGNTLATVAHIEVTAPLLRDWLDIYGYDIAPVSASVQPIEDIRQSLDARVQHMHATLTDRLYEHWLARVMKT
jgi:GMP synthase-like glutamine amidotransferase